MLHFQVSPPKKTVKVNENEKIVPPTYLVLGTFTTVPKIHFDRVSLGQSKERTLIIRNPTDHNVYFRIMKRPSKGFSLSCELENNIPAEDQLIIDIVWKPEELGSCFQAISCQSDLSGIKLSVHLMGECTPAPPQKKGMKLSRPLIRIPIPTPSSNPILGCERNNIPTTPNVVFKQPEPTKPKEITAGNSQDPILRRETFNVDKENSPQCVEAEREREPEFTPRTPPLQMISSIIHSTQFQFTPDPSQPQSSKKLAWNRGLSSLDIETVEEAGESSDSGSRRGTYVLDETDDEIQRTLETMDQVLQEAAGLQDMLARIVF